jgi:hypothetical protein
MRMSLRRFSIAAIMAKGAGANKCAPPRAQARRKRRLQTSFARRLWEPAHGLTGLSGWALVVEKGRRPWSIRKNR